VLSVILLVFWLVIAFAMLRTVRAVPLVERLRPKDPVKWPRVSVIVPACNEAATLDAAMRSRLGEGYPDAEYVLVDDRSTDGTGAIVDRLAQDDDRIVPIHLKELPQGWLGKVHAMHVGVGHATGDWILFSDADVHHEPGTLERLVAYCEERGLDHLAALPEVWSSTFGCDVALTTFFRLFMVGARAWQVTDPKSRTSVGGGVFCLVRREALEKAGGLAPLKLEVVDDMALGQMLKWSGARQAIVNARGFVRLWYYTSVGELVRGLEKNSFAAFGRFSVARLVLMLGLVAFVEIGPYASILGTHGWARLAAIAATGIVILVQLGLSRWMRRPVLASLFGPLGALMIIATAIRATVLTLVRGGIDWRGTHYTIDALRRGMKLVMV
jgi:hypothetical protein